MNRRTKATNLLFRRGLTKQKLLSNKKIIKKKEVQTHIILLLYLLLLFYFIICKSVPDQIEAGNISTTVIPGVKTSPSLDSGCKLLPFRWIILSQALWDSI